MAVPAAEEAAVIWAILTALSFAMSFGVTSVLALRLQRAHSELVRYVTGHGQAASGPVSAARPRSEGRQQSGRKISGCPSCEFKRQQGWPVSRAMHDRWHRDFRRP